MLGAQEGDIHDGGRRTNRKFLVPAQYPVTSRALGADILSSTPVYPLQVA